MALVLRAIVLVCALLVGFEASAEERQKLAVMPFNNQGVDERVSTILESLLTIELDRMSDYEVIGTSELKAAIGFESLRSSMGCTDVTCIAEIGGALGADVLFSSVLGRLGDRILITAKLIDVNHMTVLKRASIKMPNDENVFDRGIHDIVVELFGKPVEAKAAKVAELAKPEPVTEETMAQAPEAQTAAVQKTGSSSAGLSDAWWISSAAVGGGAVLIGALLGSSAKSYEDAAENGEYNGDTSPQRAAELAESRARAANIMYVVGGIALAASVPLFLYREKESASGATASVVPIATNRGLGFAAVIRY